MHFYFHIPFCHRICPYCSFYKHTLGDTNIKAFLDSLLREFDRQVSTHNKTISSIYFGGGTPSLLSPTHLSYLLTGLGDLHSFSKVEEITLEANPATFDLNKALLFKGLGINRVSLGIQSFNNSTLKTLGREHSGTQAKESVRILQEANFDNINIDLMFGIPGQTAQNWNADLQTVVELNVAHVSAYNLTYEEDTEFFEKLLKGEYQEDVKIGEDFFIAAHKRLENSGFEHYETSNYAKNNCKSQHNLGYWLGNDYIGIGPSAVSTVDGVRWKNIPDTAKYISQIAAVGHAQHEVENLTPEDKRLEKIALLLRTKEGIELEYLDQEKLKPLIEEKLAFIEDGKVLLSFKGSLVTDSIVEFLI